MAAIMTPLWGGPPGRRPAFVFSADEGRGVGKSVTAEMISRLYGERHRRERAVKDISTMKSRLLTPTAASIRIAKLDNVKTMKLSWAELEALVTAPAISGKQMYTGEAQRPNYLTWLITLNGVSLATDMAQRCVIIKLRRGCNDGGVVRGDRQAHRRTPRRARRRPDCSASELRGSRSSSISRWASWSAKCCVGYQMQAYFNNSYCHGNRTATSKWTRPNLAPPPTSLADCKRYISRP